MHKRFAVALLCTLLVVGFASCGSGGSGHKTDSAPIAGKPSEPSEGFTVVVLPDTQCYPSDGAPYAPSACGQGPMGDIAMMTAQMEWIATSRDSHKIAVVIGVGDIVNEGKRDNEWQAADGAYQILDQADIPYITAIGNHDYDNAGSSSLGARLTTKYNQYFGVARFAQHPWYGTSSYPTGKAESSYVTFEVGTDKYLVLSLEFFGRDAALQWADGVIAANPDRQVIIVTHAFLGPDGSRAPSQYTQGPISWGLTDGNDAESMWTKLISKYGNIIAVVNGHYGGESPAKAAAATRADRGINGNLVVQMLSNHQYTAGGGSGYLRVLNIQPAKHQIIVKTYSPYLGMLMVDGSNDFTVSYGLTN